MSIKPAIFHLVMSSICTDGSFPIVRVQDDCDGHQLSVTNDAENVVARIVRVLGPKIRIEYIDTEGRIDRLLHKDGVFTGFAAGSWE